MSDTLTILAIADVHYAKQALRDSSPTGAIMPQGLEWMLRAIEDARRTNAIDVIALLGDIVAEGGGTPGEMDLAEVANALRETGLPVVVAPGNHDRDAARVFRLFNDRPGAHAVKGYTLYSFGDPYAPDESMRLPQPDVDGFLNAPISGPIIALQHNPVYPPVPPSDYPYMPLNADAIMESYRRRGVVLSLSGHYHSGQEAAEKDGTTYLTCAALAENDYAFYIIRVTGREVKIERRALQLSAAAPRPLIDGHVHTHFGYCAVDVHPKPVLERVQKLGADGVQFVEHAGQLYLTREEYWHKVHVDDPQAIRRARENGTDRVAAFRSAMNAFRSPSVRVGLEVELDQDRELTLLEEDRNGWDVLLGAVHWLPSNVSIKSDADHLRVFMELSEKLIASGIDVLAHPFRFPEQCKLPPPKQLYGPMVKALKAHNVAAEINFHIHAPDPDFYRLCAAEGVRVVLGSDGHFLCDVADLLPHVRFLRECGIERIGWGRGDDAKAEK